MTPLYVSAKVRVKQAMYVAKFRIESKGTCLSAAKSLLADTAVTRSAATGLGFRGSRCSIYTVTDQLVFGEKLLHVSRINSEGSPGAFCWT